MRLLLTGVDRRRPRTQVLFWATESVQRFGRVVSRRQRLAVEWLISADQAKLAAIAGASQLVQSRLPAFAPQASVLQPLAALPRGTLEAAWCQRKRDNNNEIYIQNISP